MGNHLGPLAGLQLVYGASAGVWQEAVACPAPAATQLFLTLGSCTLPCVRQNWLLVF
jgi:hypothetical protein